MLTIGTYKTRCGYPVTIDQIKLHNDSGDKVTFPLKGNYYTPTKTGKLQSHYTIWTSDGNYMVLGESRLDIVE